MNDKRRLTALAGACVVTENAVEKHVGRIFRKLNLTDTQPTEHRRVLAVLEYVRSQH